MGTLLSPLPGPCGEILSNLLLQRDLFLQQHVPDIIWPSAAPGLVVARRGGAALGRATQLWTVKLACLFLLMLHGWWHHCCSLPSPAFLVGGQLIWQGLQRRAEVLPSRVNEGLHLKWKWEMGGGGVWLFWATAGCSWQDGLGHLLGYSLSVPVVGDFVRWIQPTLLWSVTTAPSLEWASLAWEGAGLPCSLVQRGHMCKQGNWALAGQEQ